MLLRLFQRQTLPASELFRGIHGAATILRTAIAWGLFVVAVVQAIVVAKLFAGCDVADGHDPHAVIDFLGFAIRIAGVVDKHGDAVAIDHLGAVADSEQISDRLLFVAAVGLLLIDDGAGVFHYASRFFDRGVGVTTGSVNEGGANDEAHT